MTGKELIAFDLDGTLAESKSCMDKEMADLIQELIDCYKVAIISGGSWEQFESQLFPTLLCLSQPEQIYCLPTSGASLYESFVHYDVNEIYSEWNLLYQESLTPEETAKILNALYRAIPLSEEYTQIYGQQIEHRVTQITFSALGQKAPLNLKNTWDPDCKKRQRIIRMLENDIPEFEIRYGGTTSIDVTKKGIDKAFGMRKLKEHLNIEYSDILFIGDALQPGGNDYPVRGLGIECIEVGGPEDTKNIIKNLIRS
jgi:HAD superfamily hydrolase (TIGR01484 family)